MSDKKVDIPGKLKKIILILSILLAFNVAGFVGITVYKHFKGLKAGEVIVTDNIITPEEESGVLENANQSPENENSNKKDALQSTSDTQNVDGNAENQEAQTAGANGVTTGSFVDSLQTSNTSGGQDTGDIGGSGRGTSSSSVTESSNATNITL